MEQPKSQTAFDPNRSVFTAPAARFAYLELLNPLLLVPERSKKVTLKINAATNVVVQNGDTPYPGQPHNLPAKLMEIPQPNIMTCGLASSLGGNAGMGCEAATNGGCPILIRYGRQGPFNMIIEKNGKVDSAPCYRVYCGITNSGRPTSQVHYQIDEWNILTDRTSAPENIREDGREVVRDREVPHLAPFYEELKVGRFAVEAEPPKKRGRSKGSKNGRSGEGASEGRDREDRPSAEV